MSSQHISWIAAAIGVMFALACQTSARGETREWRASDHDQSDAPNPGKVTETAPTQAVGEPSPHQRDAGASAGVAPAQATGAPSPHQRDTGVVARAMQVWAAKCMRCHGQIGAGDGPEGAVVAAANLTDSSWQAAVSDARIAQSIREGRGRMPAFAFEPDVVDGLVQLIRQMGGRSPSASSPEPRVSPDSEAN